MMTPQSGDNRLMPPQITLELVAGHRIRLTYCGDSIFDRAVWEVRSNLRAGSQQDDPSYWAAMDGVESVVLAHHLAGVNVQSPAYITGLNTALEAIANNG